MIQDKMIRDLIEKEYRYQERVISLTASENYASPSVMEATGSILANRYSEGKINQRYYQGLEIIDEIEALACTRACTLFKAEHANVQILSGSPANLAALLALAPPQSTIMGMALSSGGHLTHGHSVSFSGTLYKPVQYETNLQGWLDYDDIRTRARAHKPQVIIAGASAYARKIDFQAFRSIADEVGAKLMADISHIAGLVATGAHPSPVGIADVVTSTTHKTLRGPRSGLILCSKEDSQKIDRAVFPFLQGGPHNHSIAAKAVAFQEAMEPEFTTYIDQVLKNCVTLAETLSGHGYDLVTDGTDNHLLLIDLRSKNISGKKAALALEAVNIIGNANAVPGDPAGPRRPSGLRLGTAAITTRGIKKDGTVYIGNMINNAINAADDPQKLEKIATSVREFAQTFPIFKD